MPSILFTIIGIIIGVVVAGAGVYYWSKEKKDSESVMVYRSTTVIGVLIVIVVAVKSFVIG